MKKFICLIFAALLITLLFADTIDKNHIHKWKRIDDEHYQCLVCGQIQEQSKIFFKESPPIITKEKIAVIKEFWIKHEDNILLFYYATVTIIVLIIAFKRDKKTAKKVKQINSNKINDKPLTRENYIHDCNFLTAVATIVPLVMVTTFFTLLIDLGIIGFVIALIPGLIASIVGAFAAHTANVINAQYYNLNANDSLVQKEKLKQKEALAGIVATTAYTAHKAKKTVKEITDVDNWPQMK